MTLNFSKGSIDLAYTPTLLTVTNTGADTISAGQLVSYDLAADNPNSVVKTTTTTTTPYCGIAALVNNVDTFSQGSELVVMTEGFIWVEASASPIVGKVFYDLTTSTFVVATGANIEDLSTVATWTTKIQPRTPLPAYDIARIKVNF